MKGLKRKFYWGFGEATTLSTVATAEPLAKVRSDRVTRPQAGGVPYRQPIRADRQSIAAIEDCMRVKLDQTCRERI